MKTTHIIVSVFLFLACAEALLPAQSISGRIVSQNSLSSPLVRSMDVDEHGYVWIGTGAGLNRFDGTSYVHWTDYGEGALVSEQIYSVLTDTEDRVWVNSTSGIELIRNGEVDHTFKFVPGRFTCMRNYDSSHLLVGMWGGLYLMDKSTGALTLVYKDDSLQYYSFHLFNDGTVWILRGIPGVCTILGKDFSVKGNLRYGDAVVYDCHEGNDGTVYTLTSAGLKRFTSLGEELPVPDNLSGIKDSPVLFMVKGKDTEETFVGVSGLGILSYDGYNGPLRKLSSNETLSGMNRVYAVVCDGVILIGKSDGLLTPIPIQENFTKINIPGMGQSEALNMFYPCYNGKDVLVLSNRSFYEYDRDKDQVSKIEAEGLGGNDRLSISLLDRRDSSIWIMANYDRLEHYTRNASGDSFSIDKTWDVDPSECIWQQEDGAVCLLQGGKILKIYPEHEEYLPLAGVLPDFWYCASTCSGKVYFLSQDAVWLLGEDGSPYLFFEDNVSPTCFYEDSNGVFWIGTSLDGIIKFDPQSGQKSRITREKGLPSSSIYSLFGDGDYIVAVSRFIVSKIDRHTLDIVSRKNYMNFVGGFSTNSAKLMGDHYLLGTNIGLIATSNKDGIKDNNPSVRLEEIRVDGETDHNIMHGKPLEHGHSSITFFFSTLSFEPGYTPSYQCRLLGYDDSWSSVWTNPSASYSGLRGGKYRFEVKLQQPSGEWSEPLVSLPFKIRYPWWANPFAYLVYLVLAAAVTFLLIGYFTRQKINREKLAIVEGEKLLAEQISQERMTFFTNVSHEFRTPLALIYGPVQDLSKSERIAPEDMGLVRIIKKNADRMARLTDQLLDFNKKKDIEGSLAIMEVDLSKLLLMILGNFEYMFSQKNIRLKSDVPESLNVYCDSEKVERVVFNLLSNAVKYTPEYGEVVLSVKKDEDGMVRIAVADSGIGISREKADKIFDRFERVGEKVSGELPSGFGIGLSYAKYLAHIHKGDLTVASNEPIGSVFTFSFPYGKEAYADVSVWDTRNEEEENPTKLDETLQDVQEHKDVHVLVVEDNADMVSYLKSILEGKYSVTSASDGEQAWKFLRIQAPDIVISDVMMPYKDGYTLCKEIKNDPDFCHIPIVLLTAKSDMESKLHGLNLGADAYLDKPFESKYLLAVIDNMLANRRRIQKILSEKTEVSEEDGLSPYDMDFLQKVYSLIEKHLDDENFNVTTIAVEMGVSRTTLFTKIKALLGESPQELLSSYRLGRAMELLKEHSLNVSEVAFKVGFSTLTGFSRAFKNKYGVPPSSV